MSASTARKRTHVVLPADLVARIDELVGARGRSRFIAEAAEQWLQLERQRRALEIGRGAWKDEDHPELNGPDGTVGWVRRMREEDTRRLEELLLEHE
jgi:Arc/MetJ-type ribon-helix-helix transcriptional regulator